MKVLWTEAAIADLRAIQSYISRHSTRYADSVVERIIDRADSLGVHPQIGAIVPEYGVEDIRELLETPYRIVYRVVSEQVDIVAVVHAARIMPPDLRAD